jgi:acyl-CoA thioesterase
LTRRGLDGERAGVGSAFFVSTAVEPKGDGRYDAAVDESFNLWPLPQGGIVTALALRAMTEELGDPSERLRTLHTTFVAQVAHGPVHIDVEVLRRGRSMSHLKAEVANEGADRGHITTAVFGRTREGFEFTDLVPPSDIPPPDTCESFRDPPPPDFDGQREPLPFWTEWVEGRAVLGHAPWEDYVPDRAELAAWYRFDDPPFLEDGTLDPLALVVLADTMPGAAGQKVGRQDRPWFAPSIDLTVHLLDDCRSPWVLGHNRARYAGDGYASADMALWDCGPEGIDSPKLVAYATQLFLFSFAS